MLRTWPHSVIWANYEWISCSEPNKKNILPSTAQGCCFQRKTSYAPAAITAHLEWLVHMAYSNCISFWGSWITEIVQALSDTKNTVFIALMVEIMKDVNVKKRYCMFKRCYVFKSSHNVTGSIQNITA